MQTALTGQVNILELPIVAKATGNPITSGTVNFYLRAKDGANAGKWYKGSDGLWYATEQIAGAATHSADGHWYLSFPAAVWTRDVRYRLYAKENGDLHIPVGDDVLGKSENLDRILKAMAAGNIRDKSGVIDTYEILDPDDGSTVVAEVVLSDTSPYWQITILI